MKKLIIVFLAVLCAISAVSCKSTDTGNEQSNMPLDDAERAFFEATVLEVNDNSLLVEPAADSNEIRSSDKISVSTKNAGKLGVSSGDRVQIEYDGMIAESYPAQINNVISITPVYDWGITLTAENITAAGLTIVCVQSGGETDGELSTGSFYILEKKTENGWEELPYIVDGDVGWDSVAYIVNMNGETRFEENWSWLYGELEPGAYRIGKDFLNLREPGDYDKARLYAEFAIVD